MIDTLTTKQLSWSFRYLTTKSWCLVDIAIITDDNNNNNVLSILSTFVTTVIMNMEITNWSMLDSYWKPVSTRQPFLPSTGLFNNGHPRSFHRKSHPKQALHPNTLTSRPSSQDSVVYKSKFNQSVILLNHNPLSSMGTFSNIRHGWNLQPSYCNNISRYTLLFENIAQNNLHIIFFRLTVCISWNYT